MELDTLIAEVGERAIARHRRPKMPRAEAERLLTALCASTPAGAAPAPRVDTPPGAAPPDPLAGDNPEDSAERSGRARELKAAARRMTGGQRVVRARPKNRDTLDHVTDPFLDQAQGMAAERTRPAPRSALLRPPSRPLPYLPPPPEPAPRRDSPTRTAMGALFEGEESTDGLVFLGDEPDGPNGFEQQAGTDPAITPLLDGDRDEVDSIERTAENLDAPLPIGGTLPEFLAVGGESPLPTREAGAGELPPPQLAGAEEPMPMDVPAAPFGFGPADAEPTRVERHPTPSSPPERHAPGHLSEAVVVSSVKKLFRR